MRHTRILLAAAVLLSLPLLSCKSSAKKSREALIGADVVQSNLSQSCSNFTTAVSTAAKHIELAADDKEVTRFSLVWRLRTLEECQRISGLIDPRIGLLDLWTLAEQNVRYFESGEGQQLLGGKADGAVKGLQTELGSIAGVVEGTLPKEAYERAEKEVAKFAAENPIEGYFLRRMNRISDQEGARGNPLAWLSNISLNPFALGEGVEASAAAIDNVAVAAQRFTNVVNNLPIQVSWQTQLLLLGLQDNPRVTELQKTVLQFSDAVDRISRSTEDLPGQIRTELRGAIDDAKEAGVDVDESLRQVRAATDDLRKLVSEVDAGVKSAGKTVEETDQASRSLAEAGTAWKPTIEAVDHLINPPPDPDAPPPDPDVEPFQMPQVTEAATALTGSATELRELLEELRGFVGSDEVPTLLTDVDDTTKSAVDHGALRAADLADHLTWRGILLAVAIAVIALAYQFVSTRFMSPKA